MTIEEQNQALMIADDEGTGLQVQQVSAIAAITRSEVETQLDAAHKYPRSIKRFLDEANAMVSRSVDVASMCFYSLPRDGKQIMGPSVRLAEIAASAYGNLHVGARPLEVQDGDTVCTAQGVAWDLQKNLRVTVEKTRRITGKSGKRYSDDMVITTQNAAASIALRDAIFRVIPRAYIDEVYKRARAVAVGDAKAIGERRVNAIAALTKMGATQERILAALGRSEVEAITLEDLERLIGNFTAIKDGSTSVDEAFPEIPKTIAIVATGDEGRRMKLGSDTKKPVVTLDTSAVTSDPIT
jgi:hypothetical protein